MPVVINARPERGFDDPIGLLGDCHRRIERFLSVLARVAAEGRGPLDAATGAAFENALRYFRDAAPKHTADEEHSLFPRLRQSGHPEAAAAAAQRLSRLLAELAALYGSHIAAEDNEVFPVAARVLSLADRAAMGGEMAARRGLNLRNR
jgi:hemerythrin-like domain-containing protein